MANEYMLGRSAASAVKVPADRVGVSSQHARITVRDNGEWKIEDLNSTNGLYVRDDKGIFQRVYSKTIDENTVIRLGKEGHDSFTFMAHRVVEPDDNSYAYEFRRLKKKLKDLGEQEEALEKKNSRNMKIVKAASPIALGLCVIAQYGIPGLKDKSDLNLWISRIAMGVAPMVIGIFFGVDTHAMKMQKQKRQRLLTCPRCGYPLSEFDIHNMQCTRCKAK